MKRKQIRSALLALIFAGLPASGAASELQLFWRGAIDPVKPLKSWKFKELSTLKGRSLREKDSTGKAVQWKGVELSSLIDQALESLTVDQRAQIDLLVLKNAEGQQAIMPRYLVKKFPLILATEKDGRTLGARPEVVVPMSQSRIDKEGLPLATYQIKSPTEVELTSYNLRFSNFFLKRRTDPAAIRGEKMFVNNCIGCHATGHGRGLAAFSSGGVRMLGPSGHPPGPGVPKLTERDLRALTSYFNAFLAENTTPANQGTAQQELFRQSARTQASR